MAEDKNFARRTWEWVSHIHVITWLIEIIHWLTAQWSVVVSATLSIGAAYWAWATQWGYLPVALVALGVFVASIWGLNGILWLRRQSRPSRARISFDYSYGLPLENVVGSLDPENKDNTLEIRLVVRNVASGPAKVLLEKMRVTIEDRFVEVTNIPFVLPRDLRLTVIPNAGFKLEAYRKFKDRTTGQLEYSMLYGHPSEAYSRRATKTLQLDVFKRKNPGKKESLTVNWLLRTEDDLAL